MAHKVKRLALTIEMAEPTDRDLVISDVTEHIAQLLSEGYLSGEVHIVGPRGGEKRGWWNLSEPAL